MKNINVIGEPRIDFRPRQATLGIRFTAPFRGMFKLIDQVNRQLDGWIKHSGVQPAGPRFLRYYVIDMAGWMHLEVGIPVSEGVDLAGSPEAEIQAGELPAGRYASLIYSGSGLQGNKALIEWARASGLAWDRWDDPRGDAFRARYESFLTDPKVEPRKTRWQIEVAIKLADDAQVG